MTPSTNNLQTRNRSSFVFLTGLLLAAGMAIWLDGFGTYILSRGASTIEVGQEDTLQPLAPRDLNAADMAAAKTAWSYIEQNTRPETGMVDSVAGFPSTTLWDQGSYVMALGAAVTLGIIDQPEYDRRVTMLLDSLGGMPLYDGRLPNKAYHTQTLAMVNYDNSPAPDGIGWSALDIARLLAGLRVLERRSPEYGERIRALLARWDLAAMANLGELTGAAREAGETILVQEGRIGYEQYGARAAALWGLDVIPAMSAGRIVRWRDVSGVSVPTDLRSSDTFRAINPTLSEPYMLQGLELGLDAESRRLASQVYLAQEARYRAEGIYTMVSEDHIDRSPSFLYNSVFSNGRDWAVVTEDGDAHPALRTVSLKAAFAWDSLYGREYTAGLRAELADLATDRGWYAGRYESGEANDVLTLNTNAVVLEAVHYKAFGPLWRVR